MEEEKEAIQLLDWLSSWELTAWTEDKRSKTWTLYIFIYTENPPSHWQRDRQSGLYSSYLPERAKTCRYREWDPLASNVVHAHADQLPRPYSQLWELNAAYVALAYQSGFNPPAVSRRKEGGYNKVGCKLVHHLSSRRALKERLDVLPYERDISHRSPSWNREQPRYKPDKVSGLPSLPLPPLRARTIPHHKTDTSHGGIAKSTNQSSRSLNLSS